MKVLISNDGATAHYFIRHGLAKVFSVCEHDCVIWEMSQKNCYDMFDEFEPDIFISQTYNLDDDIFRCIEERPHLKVIMKGSEWGSESLFNAEKYPILVVNEKERENVLRLKEQTGKPNFLYVHYHPDWIPQTHDLWMSNGVDVISLMNAADVFDYTGGLEKPQYKSDLTFVGGYWGYKSLTLDKWLGPMLINLDYNFKLFGNQPWPYPQYCGFLQTEEVKHALRSATICPNISEPHSQDLGYDVIERPFKLLSNKCFVISDYVEGLKKVFNNDELVFSDSPSDFQEKVDYYLKNPEEREPYIERGFKKVIDEHTYFERVEQIFSQLGYENEAENVKVRKQQILEQIL